MEFSKGTTSRTLGKRKDAWQFPRLIKDSSKMIRFADFSNITYTLLLSICRIWKVKVVKGFVTTWQKCHIDVVEIRRYRPSLVDPRVSAKQRHYQFSAEWSICDRQSGPVSRSANWWDYRLLQMFMVASIDVIYAIQHLANMISANMTIIPPRQRKVKFRQNNNLIELGRMTKLSFRRIVSPIWDITIWAKSRQYCLGKITASVFSAKWRHRYLGRFMAASSLARDEAITSEKRRLTIRQSNKINFRQNNPHYYFSKILNFSKTTTLFKKLA